MASDSDAPVPTIDDLKSQRYGFDDHPLEHFRGLTAEEIESHAGIGPKYRERIQQALAQLAALEAEAEPAPEPQPETEPPPSVEPMPAPHEVEAVAAELEPVGSGRFAATVMVILVILVIIAAVVLTQKSADEETYKDQYNAAQEQISALTRASESIATGSIAAAGEAALRVYQRAEEGNFGLAGEHLVAVRASLVALGATRAEQPDFQARVTAAMSAADAAQAALSLSTPQTQEQVEAACQSLTDAVAALAPQEARE